VGDTTLAYLAFGALAVVGLQGLLVIAMFSRGAWASLRVARWRRRSRVLDDLLSQIEDEPSVHVRREIATRRIGHDLELLEAWLERVAERGSDPADLDPVVFEDAGLVQRSLDDLQTARRWTRRATAAAILGWTGSPRAVPVLLERVQDVHGEVSAVRAVALRALGRIRHPEAVAPLAGALASPETWLPPVVASTLARIGGPARTALADRLADPDENEVVRRWSAQILGDLGDRRSLPVLCTALEDTDAELRARAAQALGAIGDPRAVERLLPRLLVDPVPFVRTAVARALGRVGADRAMQLLVEALADPEWWVRLRAIEALEKIGSPARDLLVATLSDPDPQVRRGAARALEGIGVVAESIAIVRRDGYVASTDELLVEIGKAGNIEPLLDELESDDEEFLRGIVRILGRVGNPHAGHDLVRLLDRLESPGARARVIDALVRVGDGGHVERILPLLQDPDEWVRKEAVTYVAVHGDESVRGAVLPLLDDPNPWTRESALRVLERLHPDPEAIPVLVARLEDEEDFVCAQAVRTLCAMGAFDALIMGGVLPRMAHAEVREALLDGVEAAGTPDALVLIRHLAAFVDVQDLQRLRRAAVVALAPLPSDHIDTLVEDAFRPGRAPSDRWLAAVAWERAGRAVGERTLERLAGDEDPRVRAMVLLSLSSRTPPDAADRILAALDDDAPLVVRAAVAMAVRMGLTGAGPRLRALMRSVVSCRSNRVRPQLGQLMYSVR